MFKSLQIGRAVAALLVVLHHATLGSLAFYGEAFDGFWGFGNIGVDFFFVLSGFIIYWAHKNDEAGRKSASRYWKKRFFRLYPAFIPISIAMLVLYTIFPNLSQGGREISLLSSLFLIPSAYGGGGLIRKLDFDARVPFLCSIFALLHFKKVLLGCPGCLVLPYSFFAFNRYQ